MGDSDRRIPLLPLLLTILLAAACTNSGTNEAKSRSAANLAPNSPATTQAGVPTLTTRASATTAIAPPPTYSATTTLPPGVTIPRSTLPDPGGCATASLAVTASLQGQQPAVCVHVGAILNVTFDGRSGNPVLSSIGPCNPCVNDHSILTVISRSGTGYVFVSQLQATKPGTTSVYASWNDPNAATSPPTTTPPPSYGVTVTVIS
jgi:hypothetical protein